MSDLLPNIMFQTDFLEPNQATSLFLSLKETVSWNKQMKSRYTASFGVTYQYSQMSYDKMLMPPSLQTLANRIADLIKFEPNNCLLNYYLDGNSKMGFHSDDVSQLDKGTGVAIISLGEAREMIFKHRELSTITASYELKNGCLMYMDNEVQRNWLHSIPKSDTHLGRISLTFRKLLT